MADEIATLKHLQVSLNQAFEAVYEAKDTKSLATAKEVLAGLGNGTASAALGVVFAIKELVFQGSPSTIATKVTC